MPSRVGSRRTSGSHKTPSRGSSSAIQKKRGQKRKYDLSWLNRRTIIPYLSMTQDEAARLLGCSASTLKRHFYTLHMGRWPLNKPSPQPAPQLPHFSDESTDDEVSARHISILDPRHKIAYVVNPSDSDPNAEFLIRLMQRYKTRARILSVPMTTPF